MRHLTALLFAAFGMTTGCATMNRAPLPPEQRLEYFTCRGQTLTDVERNLVMSNAPISARGEGWIQTDFFKSMSDDTGFGVGEGFLYRITASVTSSTARDVKWTAAQKYNEFQAERDMEMTKGNLEATLWVKMFNAVRRRVCGDDNFFPDPSSKKPARADHGNTEEYTY